MSLHKLTYKLDLNKRQKSAHTLTMLRAFFFSLRIYISFAISFIHSQFSIAIADARFPLTPRSTKYRVTVARGERRGRKTHFKLRKTNRLCRFSSTTRDTTRAKLVSDPREVKQRVQPASSCGVCARDETLPINTLVTDFSRSVKRRQRRCTRGTPFDTRTDQQTLQQPRHAFSIPLSRVQPLVATVHQQLKPSVVTPPYPHYSAVLN